MFGNKYEELSKDLLEAQAAIEQLKFAAEFNKKEKRVSSDVIVGYYDFGYSSDPGVDLARSLSDVYPDLFVAYKVDGGYISGPRVGEKGYDYKQFISDVHNEADAVRSERTADKRSARLSGVGPEKGE